MVDSIAALSLLLLFVAVITCSTGQQCEQTLDAARFDCYPEPDASLEKCLQRQCCWRAPSKSNGNGAPYTDESVPYCYYPKDFPTYDVRSSESTEFGQRIHLNKSQAAYMPFDLADLTVDLIYESTHRLRVRIYDPANKRYEVPLPVPVVTKKVNVTDYVVQVNNRPFSLHVTRRTTGAVL
jgi:lysosomal alpha-glucosidase